MSQTTPYLQEVDFPPEKIRQQLEKVLLSPLFSNSPILKKFLSFIIQEKLKGRSNCLKEYTIALNILNKTSDFNPQENGIVRIHAGRLRRALDHYYNNQGVRDEIRITIHKGNYIPVFCKNENYPVRLALDDHDNDLLNIFDSGNTTIVSVLPFHCLNEKGIIKKFANGLGGQLSSSLRNFKNFSVISYSAIRLIAEKVSGMKEIASVYGAQFVFTGEIQSQKNNTRITIEMFRSETSELVWSHMFERKITTETIFEIQDEIIRQISDELQHSDILKLEKITADSMIAVA